MPTRPRNADRELAWGYGNVTQTPSGKWEARWRETLPDGTERRPSRRFATKDQAEDFLRKRGRQRRDGRYIPPDDLTVEDLIRNWLERGRHRWSPSTWHTYRQRAELHIIPTLGAIGASALDTPRVQHLIDQLARTYSPALVDGALHTLRAAYREGVRVGIVERNPATDVMAPRQRRKPVTVWTGDDAAAVLRHVAGDHLWAAVYRLMLTTGMRPGELRALRWGDLDRSAGTVRIERTMSRSAEGAIVVGQSTKTGRSRTVALPQSTLDALHRWRSAQATDLLATGKRHHHDYLFTTRDGAPLALTVWQRKHHALIAATGVPAISLHGMRHTAATLLMAAGVNPRIVADMLGHASVQTTLDQYSHVDKRMQQSAADALDAAISGTKTG